MTNRPPSLPSLPFLAACALASALPLSGQTAAPNASPAAPTSPPPAVILAPVSVIGTQENLQSLPGTGALILAEDFRAPGYLTLSQITARTPGVYVREEDGYGNFITVSIRGVDGNRSNKVTLMEDGILSAPSPYSAPAAYYSPKLGRMSGIEILKGSSQIAYGPHTTGGVINFLSTPILATRSFYARTTFGSDRTFYNHTTYGDTFALENGGAFGYLLEFQGQTTDGFRQIDGTHRDAGFDLAEPMLKLFWEPATTLPQRLEFKVGFTSFNANESYAGLTVADLRANPDRRYAATQFDRLESEQTRTYLKHIIEPSNAFRLESALYYNAFERTWDKLDGWAAAGTTTPTTNIGVALLDPAKLATLQGFGNDRIFTRAAFRDHEAYGFQTRADFNFETGDVAHRFTVGLRIHEDTAKGTNQQTFYDADGTGGFGPAAPGAIQNAGTQEATATALFAEHAITVGRLTVTPGARIEFIDWSNRTGGGVLTTGSEHVATGGLGFSYELSATQTLFGGIHRGASVPNPSSYSAGAKEETSLGFELGLRHRREAFRAELVGFYTEVSDLLAPQIAVGGGGLTPTRNGGDAEIYGLETLLEYDLAHAQGRDHGLPVYFSATWTSAEFTGINNRLGNGAGLFAGARNGQDVPYVPEWKLAAGIAYVATDWTLRLDTSYVTKTWGTGWNGDVRLNDNDTVANPTAVDGRIDSLFLVDLTGHYDVNPHFRLVAGVQNLFDQRGITSRAPLGPRANAPRFVFAGAEVRF